MHHATPLSLEQRLTCNSLAMIDEATEAIENEAVTDDVRDLQAIEALDLLAAMVR